MSIDLSRLFSSLNIVIEANFIDMFKLFSNLNIATETVFINLFKLSSRDFSSVTSAAILLSLKLHKYQTRTLMSLNHSQIYAIENNEFILYVNLAKKILKSFANLQFNTSLSVYVIIIIINALDQCEQTVNDVHTFLTLFFVKNELLTIDSIFDEIIIFNFANLSCSSSF